MNEAVKLLPCPFCGGTNIDPEGWVSTERKGPACDDCAGSADTVELWNSRPLSQAGAGGVVVRPLEWVQDSFGGDEYRTTAKAGLFDERYEIEPPYESMKSSFRVRRSRDIQPFAWEPSLDQAKAAAQADYETRIRSALAASPSAGEDSLHHVTGERITRKDLNNAYRSGQENGRMAAHLLDGIAVDLKPGWLKRDTANAAARVAEWDSVSEYVDGYEFRGDQDYTPNDHEKALIEDAICGYVASLPTPPAPVQTASVEAVLTVDDLAQEIRRVDGGHSLGAGALAEALAPFIAISFAKALASLTAPTQGSVVCALVPPPETYGGSPDEPWTGKIPTPSSPVSSPSPAGGVREALGSPDGWREQREILEGWTRSAFLAGEKVADPVWHKRELYGDLNRLVSWLHSAEDAARAALSSPATGEVVEAGIELLSHLKLYVLDRLTDDDALRDRMYDLTRALNPAPGHGEGGL